MVGRHNCNSLTFNTCSDVTFLFTCIKLGRISRGELLKNYSILAYFLSMNIPQIFPYYLPGLKLNYFRNKQGTLVSSPVSCLMYRLILVFVLTKKTET